MENNLNDKTAIVCGSTDGIGKSIALLMANRGCQIILVARNQDKLDSTLSELNKWKFNALKLDYLVREVIRFGGKDNDTLSMILDLHADIQLDEVSETDKDIAGIPSTMTNIT